ncbi:MAG: hypothetical protein M3336_04130, partial [Chloroflexota bacterium]|nr:hypothetical protein [Chloroflexota bacterium]
PSPSPSPGASPAASPAAKPAASPAASPAAAASPSPVAGRTISFEATDFTYNLPDSIPGGIVTLAMRNAGREEHQAQLLKLNAGVTLEQFLAALGQGETQALALVSLAGGPGALNPGPGSEEVTLDLQPGNYVVVCFIPSPDGVPHVAKGMLKPLTVTAPPAGAPGAQPTARVTVNLKDFDFETPATLPSGRNPWRVTNSGPQPHEVQVVRLGPGGSANDVLRFFSAPPSGPPPYQAVGGFQAIDANGSGSLTLDLSAGEYAFYCAVPDPGSGRRHLELGMLKQVRVE